MGQRTAAQYTGIEVAGTSRRLCNRWQGGSVDRLTVRTATARVDQAAKTQTAGMTTAARTRPAVLMARIDRHLMAGIQRDGLAGRCVSPSRL